MPDQLPSTLGKEPLIDVVFEVRFTSKVPASEVLPGVLFRQLPGDKKIERLPASDVPKQMREGDPNLRHAALAKIHWDRFHVSFSDHSIIVGCKMPYPGWNVFKDAIVLVVKEAHSVGIVEQVQRFSLKYIDLLELKNDEEPASLIAGAISIGKHDIGSGLFSLRAEIQEEGSVHIVNIISHAAARLENGSQKQGLIVDIDSIYNVQDEAFAKWIETAPGRLDDLHIRNKAMFFECLLPETIQALEPSYD